MPHSFLTIIAPLSLDRIADAAAAIDPLGNPSTPAITTIFSRLDTAGNGIHFASMHAITSTDGKRGYLLLECSADNTQQAVIIQLVTAAELLRPIFQFAADWKDGGDFGAYLTSHLVNIGTGWPDNPGLPFTGTPEFTVGRILDEEKLRAHLALLVAELPAQQSALSRLNELRASLSTDPNFSRMLETPPPAVQYIPSTAISLLPKLVASFILKYLWPLVIAVLIGAITVEWYNAAHAKHMFWPFIGALVYGAFWAGVIAVIGIIIIAILATITYLSLRTLEATDVPSDRQPEPSINAAMFARENRCAQNHMISITARKPGLVRQFTSRAIFWVIGELAAKGYYPPGFLSNIGSIHFARWVTAPHSPDVIFLSNYGGSWESYLEDFITLAHQGLTGVWSNTVGFPRSENLINKGATDGERFKRFARQSMVPTRFWFSAYPALTTTNIRTNALIRRGFAAAMTEDEALRWLALFGSAARPANGLVNNDIQSLLLGGLGFLNYGACLLCTLPADSTAARECLQRLSPHIAYNDGRRITREAVVTLGFTAQGLARLGLPEDAMSTFPFTFLEGMSTETRARMLGDTGLSAPDEWLWNATEFDTVLLVYGRTQPAVDALAAQIQLLATCYAIPLRPVQTTEPFGFADGISQPVIRGTHKALRSGDPLHLVEAGEFLLGYPDNHGNLPPVPALAAIDDPANVLPLLRPITDFNETEVEGRRDLGFNGSYLVIRQLEQDILGFKTYCEAQAAEPELAKHFDFPVTPAFIGAKLVGRWQDGSPIIRHPTYPPAELTGVYEGQAPAPRKMSMMHGVARVTPATAPVALPVNATGAANPAPVLGDAVTPPVGGSHHIENDFLFGTEDPQALRCPFGAHIRRANPRDSLDPGSTEQIAITNRHRIIRVGRQYEPSPDQNPGLLFMCLNGDIERQFEFLQQTWIGSTSFHGLTHEGDPLLGGISGEPASFTIPTAAGPVSLATLPDFVTTKGGGYFFIPGRRLIEYFCQPP